MRIQTALFTAGAAALLAATPGFAQVHNGSDTSGPITTGSSVVGGTFAPGAGTVQANASPAVTAAVVAAGTSVMSQLSAGSLPPMNGIAIPAQVQAAIAAVLAGNATPAQVQATETALASGGAGGVAKSLVQSLSALLRGDGGTGQLAAAVGTFNTLVTQSNAAFLSNPPAEFLAVASVLGSLVSSASSVDVTMRP